MRVDPVSVDTKGMRVKVFLPGSKRGARLLDGFLSNPLDLQLIHERYLSIY